MSECDMQFKVRFINNVPESDFTLKLNEITYISSIKYQQHTLYDIICLGNNKFDLYSGDTLISYTKLNAQSDTNYTICIMGSNECGILLCTYIDTLEVNNPKYANLRFIHGVPGLKLVHLVEGQANNESQLISNVAYTTTGHDYPYYGVNTGKTFISIRMADTNALLFGPIPHVFESQATYTFCLSKTPYNGYVILSIRDDILV